MRARGLRLGRERPWHPFARAVNIIAAASACAVVLGVLGFGFGTIPALGPALDPGRGVWTSAAGGEPIRTQTLRLAGLDRPVTVSFSKHGVASISAATDHDLFLALGYVHARFRLSQMDEERRLGEGRLAQLAGPSDLASDTFELQLGLLRTAQSQWAAMPKAGPPAQALLAYARGVNDDLQQVRASGQWPAAFSLTGVYPGPWTPVDSLVIQGELTQELDFTTTPLDDALLERSLGAARTMAWFPVIAPDAQNPYDPGPYLKSAPASITTARSAAMTAGEAQAAGALLAEVSRLPPGQVHEYPDSNAWAANGPAVQGSKALLAGDPHLPQTLPSVWYEVAMAAPGLDVAGVSVPGLPGVLIGHNTHIAWSLTDTQNQATLFYEERTRGGEYYWHGAWRPMQVVHYEIPVRGAGPVHLTVDLTVHGPIMTQAGQTTSVDWMGNVPSPDLAVIDAVYHATDFAQFKAALATWYAPSQNFVYADAAGNIGAISAGYYPQVAAGCQPWLPMTGTGACDVTGVIPYSAVPQVYDPPSHVLATANQRPVTAAYPYYIGTSADFFDPGYRAATIYAALRAGPGPKTPLTPAGFASLQTSLTDSLALRLVPALLSALRGTQLSSPERTAVTLLSTWNASMATGSAAAALWWTFLGYYLSDTFQPWWSHTGVPTSQDPSGLDVTVNQTSLVEDLEAWTLTDPANPAFSLPSGRARTAQQVMRTAFGAAVAHLSSALGAAPASWAWGRLHSRAFPALSGANGLGYGPRPDGGDPFTPDAANGNPVASDGPSWRMIVSLSAAGVTAEGVYPGGQSENPASPLYDDQVPLWWDGQYLPVPVPGQPAGTLTWTLDPDG